MFKINYLYNITVARNYWEAEFRRTAAALAGGSSWPMLAYNPHTGDLHNYWAWDHMHNAPAGVPLLVLDIQEHSFNMDYGMLLNRGRPAWRLWFGMEPVVAPALRAVIERSPK